MTDQPRDDQFDRLLHSYLAWQAEDLVAPPTAAEVAMRIGSRTGIGGRRARLAPQLVWVALLGLLVAGVAGAALVGAQLLQGDRVQAYEAVFLRFDETTDPPVLRVVAVDATGRERILTGLPDRVLHYGAPTGVVSPSGLLAIPSSRGEAILARPPLPLLHWEIVDLHRPHAEPRVVSGIVQDVEQLGWVPWELPESRPAPFWGPGDRLVIPWYDRTADGNVWHWSFVDGHSGETTTTGLSDDLRTSARFGVVPHWAADGSGILVAVDRRVVPQTVDGLVVLRPDGTLSDAEAPVVVAPSTYTRRYRSDGTSIILLGDSLLAEGRTLSLGHAGSTDVAWTADGSGAWLIGPGPDKAGLIIERAPIGGDPQVVATIEAPGSAPAGSRLDARFMGLAPDDSMFVIGVDRVIEAGDTSSHDRVMTTLVHLDTGATFAIDGTFAGWLETTPSRSSPSPSTLPTPSPEPVAQPPSTFTERFDSPLNGLSISYPSGWQIRRATETWTGGALDFDSPAADVIFDPALGDGLYLVLASAPHTAAGSAGILDTSVSLPEICRSEGEGGGAFYSGTIDGTHASVVARGCGTGGAGRHSARVATASRGYVIYLYLGPESPQATYDQDWFARILESVDLRPEDAVDAP